jgi:hypothetical protein
MEYNAPEGQDSEAGDHGRTRECTHALGIHVTQRSKDVVGVSTGLTQLLKTMCKNVQATRHKSVEL